jgi:hypothetical protein
MRFMLLRKADKATEAGVMPSRQLLDAMGHYMEEMGKAGVLLAGDGLQPTSKGACVNFSGGRPTVTEGPFPGRTDLLAGFAMIQVPSKQEAIEWVKRWPALDGDGDVQIEIRQMYEPEDFGAEFTPELCEAGSRSRAEWAGKP